MIAWSTTVERIEEREKELWEYSTGARCWALFLLGYFWGGGELKPGETRKTR